MFVEGISEIIAVEIIKLFSEKVLKMIIEAFSTRMTKFSNSLKIFKKKNAGEIFNVSGRGNLKKIKGIVKSIIRTVEETGEELPKSAERTQIKVA